MRLAQAASARAELRLVRLEDLDEPPDSFDLGVCNRVLQHVPERSIARVIHNLCRACRTVYVNELTTSDDLHEVFFMKWHNYPLLFGNAGLDSLESGLIGKQTYFVFGRGGLPQMPHARDA